MKPYAVAFYGPYSVYDRRYASLAAAIKYAEKIRAQHRCQLDIWFNGQRVYG